MATYTMRTLKDGTHSYKIVASSGYNTDGKQIRVYETWKAPPGLTARQEEKALTREIVEFEKRVGLGTVSKDSNQRLSEYAAYVIKQKERANLKRSTIARYKELLTRIEPALGHFKISAIRPKHLNAFYEALGKEGVRKDEGRADCKIDLQACLTEKGYSRAGLARDAHLSESTIRKAIAHERISKASAEAIAKILGQKVTAAFEISYDSTPLSAKTILEYHGLLSAIFSMAVKEMLIPYNPAEKALPPKINEVSGPKGYSSNLLAAIFEALESAPLRWKAITYVLIDTGMRRGECTGLTWDNYNPETGILVIDRAILYNKDVGLYEETTKSSNVRALRLSSDTRAVLEEWRKEQDYMRAAYGNNWRESGRIFTTDHRTRSGKPGDPMRPDSITQWQNSFAKKHGLPHLHPHGYRHTVASFLIGNGVDLTCTAAELGHKDSTTTSKIYAHQIAEAKARSDATREMIFSNRKK